MAKATEKDVLLPALRVIGKHPGCDMSTIIHEIEREMVFSPEDLEPLANRGDLKYSQIIRNLNSHYDSGNEFSKYFDRISDGRRYIYYLNEAGQTYLAHHDLDKLADDMTENIEDWEGKEVDPYDDDEDLTSKNNRAPVLKEGDNPNHRYSTDSRISQSVLRRCGYVCEYATLKGLNHPPFNARTGHYYIEAHHLIPMKAQKDFGEKNLDREENIVGLCPNCHSAVHYGTLEEKVKILKPLYDARIQLLRDCDHHIDITFEDLVNKYYM